MAKDKRILNDYGMIEKERRAALANPDYYAERAEEAERSENRSIIGSMFGILAAGGLILGTLHYIESNLEEDPHPRGSGALNDHPFLTPSN